MQEIPKALFDFFERMPRQGPGSPELTKKLLRRFRPLLGAEPVSADMGCGSGAATLILAEEGISVTGVDIHQPFLDELTRKAERRGLERLVKTRRASMLETGFAEESFDLIWSEGAVFTVGFENALTAFWPMLKKGGVLVVSDCFWFQKDVPDNVREQWNKWDENLKTVAESLKIAEKLGYRFMHSERLTPEMWEENFYCPMEKLIASIEADPDSSPDLIEMARISSHEISFFREYNRFYGYVFHVLQKP